MTAYKVATTIFPAALSIVILNIKLQHIFEYSFGGIAIETASRRKKPRDFGE